jgi:hypothetical protein
MVNKEFARSAREGALEERLSLKPGRLAIFNPMRLGRL